MIRKVSALVVDDDPTVCGAVSGFLKEQGWSAYSSHSLADAEEKIRSKRPDALIIDYSLPDGDALSFLATARSIDPLLPVVIMTGHGNIRLAVRSMQMGVDNFLTKPVDLASLHSILSRLVAGQADRRQQKAQRQQQLRNAVNPFAGTSDAIRRLADDALRVSETDASVLIQGETGTGKGTLAKWIHRTSARRRGPYVSLNCAGLSPSLLESELFGHERGAFTGAVATKQGLFESAHNGTLVLDEFGDMDLSIQPKLLNCVEEQRFHRLGSLKERSVDVRLIAATNRNLLDMVSKGRFRSDLYFRVSTFPLVLPPLRERPEDIPHLALQILDRLGEEIGKRGLELTRSAIAALCAYDWPGNIRELRNVLERAILLSRSDTIDTDLLQFQNHVPEHALPTAQGSAPTRQIYLPPEEGPALTLLELETQHIRRVLSDVDGHVGKAAEILDIPRSTLYSKLKKYRIEN